jgi:hypothetical protein
MKVFNRILFFVSTVSLFVNIVHAQQNNESFESVVKRAISSGVVKREGTQLIYVAAPGQDTAKIRSYYEGLIKTSGKPYTFQFENKISGNNSSQINSQRQTIFQQPMVQAKTNIATADELSAALDKNCLLHQAVFGELRYTEEEKQYEWDVPDGVTTIRIEAWSGGGNGYAEYFFEDHVYKHDMHKISNIKGGGGGGGAYASAEIDVRKGDRILITIPSGGEGKAVQVKLNDNKNMFYLNNGGDGKKEALNGNGIGGVSGGVYGIFTKRLFWIGGGQGEPLKAVSYTFDDGDAGNAPFAQDRAAIDKLIVETYGKGGNAALLENGGRGARIINDPFYAVDNAMSGGFPGGGGGGGGTTDPANKNFSNVALAGKGAPGMVIIHY